jgi:hypothetical protein
MTCQYYYSEDDQFADAVISEVYEGGGYCLEYTPSGSGKVLNEKICLATMQCGIEDEDWQKIEKKGNKEDMKIQLFSCKLSLILFVSFFTFEK